MSGCGSCAKLAAWIQPAARRRRPQELRLLPAAMLPSEEMAAGRFFPNDQRGGMPGLYFEQFTVGQQFDHKVHRTVTETDNVLFSTLTMNPAAIHLDAEYCKTTPYGQPLVNSVFTLGLMVGLSVYDTTFGTTVANLGWEDVKFPKPVFVGDTLRAETTVVAVRESQSRKDTGIVTFEHHAYNQRNEEVASCRRAALMLKGPPK
jgi:acyl dehydratase